jgi:hypothetical protein
MSLQINSPDIVLFDFDVLFDISLRQPGIVLTNRSIGPNLAGCSFIFTVTSPGGLQFKNGSFATPDATGAWLTFTIPNIPQIMGQIEWGGNGYTVTAVVKDSLNNQYTLSKSKAITKPKGCTKGNYGAMMVLVETRCQDAKLYVEEKSNYLYEGAAGVNTSAALKLVYPSDDAGALPQTFDYTNPFATLMIPIYRDAQGYQILAENIRDYIYDDGVTIRVRYKFKDVFDVNCTYDLCCLTKSILAYTEYVEQSDCIADWKKLTVINTKFLAILEAKQQPQCDIDIQCKVNEIKELLGSYYDCGCCNYGIQDINQTSDASLPSMVVDAGDPQTIFLPDTDAALFGSASVSGGTIISHLWEQVSGPNQATITSPTTYGTNVTGLVAGKYTFKLTAIDNTGRSKSDTVIITVLGALSVNAGIDQSISLPTATAALSGSASVTGASIVLHTWTQVSGPNNANISNATGSYTPTLSGLGAGVYVFRLTATDSMGRTASDDMTITVALPSISVNAGPDQTITKPVSSATFGATASGAGLTYAWTKISGPIVGGGIINAGNTPNMQATNLAVGVYVFRVTVTDQYAQTAFDDVQVTVVNPALHADAGVDQTTIAGATVNLNGTGSTGIGLAYAWAKIGGPSSGVVNNATSATPTMTGTVQGTYTIRLTITDQAGQSATDDVVITVQAMPVVNAGPDQTKTLPTTTATMAGSATVAGATIVSHVWSQVSGPGCTITDSSSYTTGITGMTAPGVYVFRLTATDSNGHTASDDMVIVVNPAATVTFVAEWGWASSPFTTSANQPTLDQVSETVDGTGPGFHTFQHIKVGANVLPGSIYGLQIYGHVINVTAAVGDTPQSIATKIRNAINASQDYNDASGVPSYVLSDPFSNHYPPTATIGSGGATDEVWITCNYANHFALSVTNFTIIDTFTFQGSGVFDSGAPIAADYRPAPIDSYLILRYPNTETVKTDWYNTPLNNGNIPDSVFNSFVTIGTKRNTWTKVDPGMDHSVKTTFS